MTIDSGAAYMKKPNYREFFMQKALILLKPEDVNIAVVDDNGATHFEKIKNNRELRDYLNKGLMSFGDLLVDNYKRFRE